MAPKICEETEVTKAATSVPVSREKAATQSQNKSNELTHYIYAIRTSLVLSCICLFLYRKNLQTIIDEVWSYLYSNWIFNSVYFESWFATFCYAVIIPLYPFTVHYIRGLDKYKIDPSVTYVHQTVIGMLGNAVTYLTPLMLMDTFMVKKYCGIEPEVWIEKRKDWVQTTRALPVEPPTVLQLVLHLVGSIIVYDAMFFFVHLSLHKNMWLYKHLHAVHHDHDVMHAHVTNQLSVSERIILILSANFALKVFNSHPLTRMLFVPAFIFLLVDNHHGYDLPLGLDKIVPWNLMGGPRKHYNHHINGGGNYQPFFSYLDVLWEKRKSKKS